MMDTMQTNTNSMTVGIGARLKAARELLKMSEKEAASRLHLSVKFIRLMENENFHNDTPITFLKGYLRSYGRILSISDKEIADAIDQLGMHTPDSKPLSSRLSAPISNNNEPYVKWITYLIGFVLIILVGMWWSSHTKDNEANKPSNSTSNLPENNVSVTDSTPLLNNTTLLTDVDSEQTISSSKVAPLEKNNTINKQVLSPRNEANASVIKNQTNRSVPTSGTTKSSSSSIKSQPKTLGIVTDQPQNLSPQNSNAVSPNAAPSSQALPTVETSIAADESTEASPSANLNQESNTAESAAPKKIKRHHPTHLRMVVPEPGLLTNDF